MAVLCVVVWVRVLLVRIGLRGSCERRGQYVQSEEEESEVQVF